MRWLGLFIILLVLSGPLAAVLLTVGIWLLIHGPKLSHIKIDMPKGGDKNGKPSS